MRCTHVFLRAALAGLIAGSLAAFSPAIAAVYSPEHVLPPQVIQQFLANSRRTPRAIPQWRGAADCTSPGSRCFRSCDPEAPARIAQRSKSGSGERNRHRARPGSLNGGKDGSGLCLADPRRRHRSAKQFCFSGFQRGDRRQHSTHGRNWRRRRRRGRRRGDRSVPDFWRTFYGHFRDVHHVRCQ